MGRGSWLFGFLAGVLLSQGCGRDAGPPSAPPRPPDRASEGREWKFADHNVVFVSFDALQAAHVGVLGHARNVTPNIDAVAGQGFTFTHAYSASSWTVPATMTWFTGVYPSEHRMTNKFAEYDAKVRRLARLKDMAPDLTTLAEVFGSNGYATAGFTGNAGVSGGFGFQQGFDVYFHDQGNFGGFSRTLPRALAWLEENKGKKFFLFLHGYDVHGQYLPGGGLDYRFVDKDYDGRYTGAPLEQEILREEGLEKGRVELREQDVRFWRAVYDEKIQRADAKFGRFLAEFGKMDLGDKTIFVLTSDHGTEFHEHGRFDHGFTLYDELIHVPLVFKLPGRKGGKKIASRVGSIDLMPTLIDLLDLKVADQARGRLRGKSLVPALRGDEVRRDIFSETNYRDYTFKRAVITPEGWKLIVTLEDNTQELFDLKTDPGELKNLAEIQAERAADLKGKLFGHYRAIGQDLTARRWIRGLNPVYDSQAK